LRVFEREIQGRIFGPKRDEKIGGCKKPYSKELGDFYFSRNANKMSNSRGHVVLVW
jgi:hypothetical protein